MSVGLGPEDYDCSGLVIRAISGVLGRMPEAWSPRLRHVRQMSRLASSAPLEVTQPGDILTLGKTYTIGGQNKLVPAHAGIVTDVNEYGLRLVHAQAARGKVLASTLKFSDPHRFGIVLGTVEPKQLAHPGVL